MSVPAGGKKRLCSALTKGRSSALVRPSTCDRHHIPWQLLLLQAIKVSIKLGAKKAVMAASIQSSCCQGSAEMLAPSHLFLKYVGVHHGCNLCITVSWMTPLPVHHPVLRAEPQEDIEDALQL